jgi:hypothetical protein
VSGASGNTQKKVTREVRGSLEKKEGVDGFKKVLHNLISLLLTNKTLCSKQAETLKRSVNCKVELIVKAATQNTDL